MRHPVWHQVEMRLMQPPVNDGMGIYTAYIASRQAYKQASIHNLSI